MRVSQAERDEVASALARHFAEGRLSLDEYEERVEAALSARTGRDLAPLFADLPEEPRPRARRPRPARTERTAGVAPVRVIAVAAVIVLAVASGPWALWLLWPALLLTGSCGRRYRRDGAYRPPRQRPVVDQHV